MRAKIIGIVLAAVCLGGVWTLSSGERSVAVNDAERARSAADGTGAGRIELALTPTDAPAAGRSAAPTSLAAIRALGDHASLAAARQALEHGLAREAAATGELHVLLSEVCRRLRDADAAVDFGRRGAELLPLLGDAHHTYARALALRMQTSSRVTALMTIGAYKDELRTAIELDPTNAEARKEEALTYAFAPAPLGDAGLAIQRARELVAIDPILGADALGRALFESGERDEGLRVLREASAAHPDSRELSWVLGTLLERAGARHEADQAFAAAMRGEARGETYYQAACQRARMRIDAGDELEAALDFLDGFLEAKPAWEWTPSLAEGWELRGAALEGLGRAREAHEAYERALGLGPGSERALQGAARTGD